jgi:hypothetical protein
MLQPPLSRYVAEYILAHRDYLSEKARESQSRRHKRRRKPDDKTSRTSLG